MKTAAHWHRTEGGKVQCDLCPHRCTVAEGKQGRCRVRWVRHGELIALAYGCVSSANLDPIEKKPLYHFHPGADIFSVGGWGCNFSCRFCQNWSISQEYREQGARHRAEDIVDSALRGAHGRPSVGIAYTYNEPLIAFEFVRDCAALAREQGLTNVLVTNGYVNPEPAAELLPLIDALNVDIKSSDADFYREYCGGTLEPVLAFAQQAVAAGCHVEATNLVIPGLNDGRETIAALAGWIADNLGPAIPLHLSAYRPEYHMDIARTPSATLEEAWTLCRERLDYVYVGNIVSTQGQDTVCPGCGHALVRRQGYRTRITGVRDGACTSCGRKADLVLS